MYFLCLCTVAQCPGLDPPANGNIETTGMDFWDTATYSCDRGFNLVGVNTRTCQANGGWSGTPPFCTGKYCLLLTSSKSDLYIANVLIGLWYLFTAVQCPVLESPKDGQVQFTSTSFGAVARYRCHAGFTLEGDEERTCQADGSWSGTIPLCRRILQHCVPCTFTTV